jgi:hypothetical protein
MYFKILVLGANKCALSKSIQDVLQSNCF